MPWWQFWREPTEEEKKIERDQKEAYAALERGDIPPLAKERIQKELAGGKNFFSSDLSVREFLLTKEAGIQPVGQVMGTSFFNVSFWGSYMGPLRVTGELEKITHAQTEARKLAISRMKTEAKLLGASGVIGVRVEAKSSTYATRMTEFTAYGTAVRIPNYPPDAEPFTCDLNGQDFWQLYKAGYRPKSIVMGMCSYYLNTNWRAYMQQYGLFGFGGFANQEITQYTEGFIDARKRAESRLTQELYECIADGAVGMKISYDIEQIVYSSSNNQVDLLIHFMAIGTGVDLVEPSQRTSPTWYIDLRRDNDRSSQIKFDENRYQTETASENFIGS